MTLPFLLHKNFLEIGKMSEFTNMGRIDLVQFAALRSANGVTTNGVTIMAYAWLEDVELSGFTDAGVLQAKKEYVGNGQISGPASTVASIASRLSDAPVIGGFAKATEMVAGAVGSVASYFGFTNVPNIRDVEPFKPTAFHTLASSSISEPINKLSLQPKQEIAIGATHDGGPAEDELSIKSLVTRESFLTGSLWSTTDATDKILFTTAITPQLLNVSVSSGKTIVYATPMHYVSRLFKYWRGDLIFRFKIIRSQFHRGRINIAWDTTASNLASGPVTGQPTVFNVVMDLEEDDEVELRVPYLQSKPFQKLWSNSSEFVMWSNGATPTGGTADSNGVLQVRVLSQLTAPEASSDVDLLVFVRGGDEMEFAVPVNPPELATHMVLQSKKTYINMGADTKSDPQVYDEMFGERIVSLRELLHRQSKVCTHVIPNAVFAANGVMLWRVPFRRTPRPYGYTINGLEKADSIVGPAGTYKSFNYSQVHPITWVLACFIGYKGSTNNTFNALRLGASGDSLYSSVSVSRTDDTTNVIPSYSTFVQSAGSQSQMMSALNGGVGTSVGLPSGATGVALTHQATQAGLSVNLPYYANSKFFYRNLDYHNYQNLALPDGSADDLFLFLALRKVTTVADDSSILEQYCGTGPDFQLIYFLNVPAYIRVGSTTPSPT
jgi:hypothetical protein